ncbi:MAG: AzlD domain-containing protein [Chloroflexi bacterium]|nr:AzlD domain-containing protein [Chloroflexota bacterium]
MELWLIILVAGIVTYATRLSFIAAHGRVDMPVWFTRGLAFVPVVVLSAIILPELLAHGGAFDVSLGNARLLAGILAGLIAWRTKNVWLTIALGMIALFALQAFQ